MVLVDFFHLSCFSFTGFGDPSTTINEFWLRSYNGDCNNGAGVILVLQSYKFGSPICPFRPAAANDTALVFCRAVPANIFGIELRHPDLFLLNIESGDWATEVLANTACMSLMPNSTLFESMLAQVTEGPGSKVR